MASAGVPHVTAVARFVLRVGVFGALAAAMAPPLAAQNTNYELMRDAANQLAAGDAAKAIETYSQAIKLRLDDADAWFGRGKAYEAAGRYRDAVDDFDQAARLRPSFLDAVLERGYAYGQSGDLKRAIEDLDRVIAIAPTNVPALTLRGDAHGRLGQFSQAIADFSAAVALAPNDVHIRLARSYVYALTGQNQLALDDRNEAVRIAPDNPEVYLARGGSYHELGLHDKGFADRTEAIRLKPDFAEAWCARGSAYYLLGDFRKAIPDLEEALRLKPDYTEAKNVLEKARVELAKQTLTAPLQSGAQAARIGDASTRPATPLAGVSQPEAARTPSAPIATNRVNPTPAAPPPASPPSQPKPTAAPLPTSARAGAIAPPNARAIELNRHGRELIQQHHYRDAIDELTAALQEKPDFVQALNARGFAYNLIQNWKFALEDLNEAIRLDPNYPNAYVNRAVTRKALGDAAGAQADQAAARAILSGKTVSVASAPEAASVVPPPAPATLAPRAAPPATANVPAVAATAESRPAPKAPSPPAPKAEPARRSTSGASVSAAEYNRRGRELIQQHRYAQAVEELSAALREQPTFTAALNARGFAYNLLRDWPHALADFDAVIRIDARYANAYANRAIARKATGDEAGAEADRAKVRELTGRK